MSSDLRHLELRYGQSNGKYKCDDSISSEVSLLCIMLFRQKRNKPKLKILALSWGPKVKRLWFVQVKDKR